MNATLCYKIHNFLDGSDYHDIGAQVFYFGPAVSHFSVNVSLINDNSFELTESFQAGLRFPSPPLPRVTLYPAQGSIEILDDDGNNQGFDREVVKTWVPPPPTRSTPKKT